MTTTTDKIQTVANLLIKHNVDSKKSVRVSNVGITYTLLTGFDAKGGAVFQRAYLDEFTCVRIYDELYGVV